MNVAETRGGDLRRAFRDFERAASGLEAGHTALLREVRGLESRLLAANRQLEAVLDAMDIGVAVVRSSGGILRTNAAFDELELCEGGEDRRVLSDPDFLRLAGGGSAGGGLLRLVRSTPRGPRDLAARAIPVGDDGSTCVITVQDVTEIRRQEEEGGRRRRLEALGRMAAELAHEVRNPLGSIRLFTSMLREDLEEAPSAREMLDQVQTAVSSLEATVSNLLSFCAPARASRRRVSLAGLAEEVCSLVAPACLLRGIDLVSPSGAADRDPCDVEVDPEGVRRILLNLLGNALGATGRGGRIEVSAALEGSVAVLKVRDSGRGIDPHDLPRVFDPFFSRTEGGLGLGLSIVHQIVEAHQGRIFLESAPGRGTLASVEIPPEASRESPPPPDSMEEPRDA